MMKLRILPWLAPAVLLLTVAGSVHAPAQGQGQGAKPEGHVRVMTYNIQWFSEDANPQRIANLKSILDTARPDVVGLQEIQSIRALRQVFGSEWEIAGQDDARQNQELFIAVRKPYKIEKWELVFPSPTLDFAFPGNRDVLKATISTPDDKELVVYVNHFKSRRGGRMQTDSQRVMAAGLLAAYINAQTDKNEVVLGDFNDAPNDQAPNVLASGDLLTPGGPKPIERLLVNLIRPLADQDYVTIGLGDLYGGQRTFRPVSPGAKADNDRLRGKDYNFPGDVKVFQTCFDQIFVNPELATRAQVPVIYSNADSIRGDSGQTTIEGDRVIYTRKGTQASDHQPVYVDLNLR